MKKINFLGITSERVVGGKHIAALPIAGGREMCDIIYVGDHNVFANEKPHPSFSLMPEDKRYVC